MRSDKKRKLAKAVALVVVVSGMTVMAGWIFNIPVLKSISPSWVSMKFDTALAFVLSGITLYYIAKAKEGEFDVAQVVLSIASLSIILLMGILFFSALFGVRTGAEDLFVAEPAGDVKTVAPGRPSIPTMFNFILIATAGIFTILHSERLISYLKILGFIVGLIGAVAVVGYGMDAPRLYYFIDDVNSAMACHTAILFVLLGTGLVCLSN